MTDPCQQARPCRPRSAQHWLTRRVAAKIHTELNDIEVVWHDLKRTISPTTPSPTPPTSISHPSSCQALNNEQSRNLEAYSKTIITLGYAGLFAIWAFVKDHLSHRAVLTTALLVGFSLIVYIAWEVIQMIHRTTLQLRFNRAINDQPADQAKAISDYLGQTRAEATRGALIWRVILILTVVPGFVGGDSLFGTSSRA